MIRDSISVVIPAYNEEKTILNVVSVILRSKLFQQVICINDGSTDKTLEILRTFGDKIVLINFKKNKGKAAAMAAGIKICKSKLLMFIDSDLIGLNSVHLKKLYTPITKKGVDAVLGTLDSDFIEKMIILRGSPLGKGVDDLSGERVYYKDHLVPYLKRIETLGYGIETFLNSLFKGKRVHYVKLNGLVQLMKQDKRGWNYSLVKEVMKQGGDIMKVLAYQKLRSFKKIISH